MSFKDKAVDNLPNRVIQSSAFNPAEAGWFVHSSGNNYCGFTNELVTLSSIQMSSLRWCLVAYNSVYSSCQKPYSDELCLLSC